MHSWLAADRLTCVRRILALMAVLAIVAFALPVAHAQQASAPILQAAAAAPTQAENAQAGNAPAQEAGGEASLKLPDMTSVTFLHGVSGYKLLALGLIFCALGGLFGMIIYVQLKNLPVHRSMREISELIYETCKTYLITQGKFILILEAFIAVVI